MGSTHLTGYDKNRRRRVYPYIGRVKKTPNNFEYSESSSQVGEQAFVASSQETFAFSTPFANVPVVILTATEDASIAGIIPYASNITNNNVTIETSDSFTGTIYVLAVDITNVYVGDGNRFRKTYPSLYRIPIYENTSQALGATVITETAAVSFSAQTTVTYNFVSSFSTAPTVVITPGENASSGGVVAYVSAISSTSVTIETSESFTGVVYMYATEA